MPAIPGVGTSGGLSFQLNALNITTSAQELYSAQQKLLKLMQKDGVVEKDLTCITEDYLQYVIKESKFSWNKIQERRIHFRPHSIGLQFLKYPKELMY